MSQTQTGLFPADEMTESTDNLYADIVFDRPLDQAFSYAVPENLRESLAIGKRVLAPFGRGDKQTIGFCVGLTTIEPEYSTKSLLRVLDEQPLLDDHLMRLTRWMADYYLCGWGQVLNAVVPAGAKDKAGTRTVAFIELLETEKDEDELKLTAKQKNVLYHLREQSTAVELRRLTRLAQCSSGVVDAVINKGLARKIRRRVDSTCEQVDDELTPDPTVFDLSEDQARVWQLVEPALQQSEHKAFLLHGVTGSGKTEIYLRAIEEVVKQGKEAIVLVPEISLTPQTIQRFKGRCDNVAVMHSHLGDAERGGHWRRISQGKVQVVVGARSAVFAPTRKLGVIIIDEEHENTFKQESTPRYHARDVAVMRARLENIPIIMGSATPSLESWHNAHRGQYSLLSLPKRVLDRPLPQVSTIDMRREVPGRIPRQALSEPLLCSMQETLKDGGQVMLLLNRRGFSTHIHCPGCGHVEQCQSCDLALTYHRQRDILLCHYCGYLQEPTKRCPACSQTQIRYQGLGTEKLQSEIESKFPEYVVRRMDSDTMRKPGSHQRVLNAFREGLIHILLGTQMIAKGLDFPNVTLVGVINADVGLHLPDFRASERTFQLLSQVAGRTGRGERGGRVLIQTYTPDHPAVVLSGTHDYPNFVSAEMAHRQAHNYPPFQRMIRIIIRSKDQDTGAEFAEQMAAAFHESLNRLKEAGHLQAEARLLGPAEAPVFRLKDYYRYHFQMQSASSGLLHQISREVLGSLRVPSAVEYTVDVDPFSMM